MFLIQSHYRCLGGKAYFENQTHCSCRGWDYGCRCSLTSLLNGWDLLLKDLSEKLIDTALDRIIASYQFTKMMTRTQSFPSLDVISERIHPTTEYTKFSDAYLVIEHINEAYMTKRDLYLELK